MTHEDDHRARDYRNHLATDPQAAHLSIMEQRCKWLTARIKAKESIGWDVIWDTAERDALAFAIERIGSGS